MVLENLGRVVCSVFCRFKLYKASFSKIFIKMTSSHQQSLGFPPHVTNRHWSHDNGNHMHRQTRSTFILNMASFLRGRRSTTEQTITRFILSASFLINHNPLLLLGLCFQALYAAIQYLVLLTTQTGSIVCSWRNLVAEKDSLYSSEVHDGDVGNPYVFSSGQSDLKSAKSSIEIDDPDFAFENESVENTAHIPHVKNRRFDLQDEISLLGIEDIVPLLANCGTKNLNKAAAKKKKDIGFFPGFGMFIQLQSAASFIEFRTFENNNVKLFPVSRKFTPVFFLLAFFSSTILLDCWGIRDFDEQRNGFRRRRVRMSSVSTVMYAVKIF